MKPFKMTLKNLDRLKKDFAALPGRSKGNQASGLERSGWLKETTVFGENPGQLQMLSYTPPNTPAHAAVVVVLHGCTQTAAAYASHVGWRELADRYCFRLLCPQQTRQNNINGCFNWFLPEDIARTGGECHSIHSMIRHMGKTDSEKPLVYITGLSAGGAMACAMLASYPELFAGGSIVAGLPYASAHNVQSAFAAMHRPQRSDAKLLGDKIREASGHAGRWPPVAIWHGSADKTVVPMNGDELCRQWLDVHGLDEDEAELLQSSREWRDASGAVVVQQFLVESMGHGAPIDGTGTYAFGSAAPFVLEAGISSSHVMAEQWGLAERVLVGELLEPQGKHVAYQRKPSSRRPHAELSNLPKHDSGNFIERTIKDALQKAGLLKS